MKTSVPGCISIFLLRCKICNKKRVTLFQAFMNSRIWSNFFCDSKILPKSITNYKILVFLSLYFKFISRFFRAKVNSFAEENQVVYYTVFLKELSLHWLNVKSNLSGSNVFLYSSINNKQFSSMSTGCLLRRRCERETISLLDCCMPNFSGIFVSFVQSTNKNASWRPRCFPIHAVKVVGGFRVV